MSDVTPEQLRAQADALEAEMIKETVVAEPATVESLDARVTRLENALADQIRYHESRQSVDPSNVTAYAVPTPAAG